MLAAQNGHLEIVRALLEKGAKINQYENSNTYYTALMLAAEKGHLEIVKYLLEKGAKINKKGDIDYAATEEIKELLRNPPHVDVIPPPPVPPPDQDL